MVLVVFESLEEEVRRTIVAGETSELLGWQLAGGRGHRGMLDWLSRELFGLRRRCDDGMRAGVCCEMVMVMG